MFNVVTISADKAFDAIKSDNDDSADKSMIFHVKALRHQFATCQIAALIWLDTRDMLADGLTKGKIDRQALIKALNSGKWFVEHPSEIWQPNVSSNVKLPWICKPK